MKGSLFNTQLVRALPVILVVALLFSAFGFSPVEAQNDIQPFRDYGTESGTPDLMTYTDQLIIQFDNKMAIQSFDASNAQAMTAKLSDTAGVPVTFLREMAGNRFVYRLPKRIAQQELRLLIQKLALLPEVLTAEPDIIMQHNLIPNDTYYGNQWHYFAPTTTTYGINAPAGWDVTTGNPNIVIAVIDTGITNHVEFAGRTVPGYDFIADVFTANDGNGRDSDPSDPGDWVTKNQCYSGSKASESSWHGTHTAGTIGAASNNGVGVAGINWQSKILPVRVLGKCGGYMSDIIDGMLWSAGLPVTGVPANPNPAKVINMSLGGAGTCDSTLQSAVNQITAAGTTIVVSAGNENLNASGFTPANCTGVITVAATSISGNRASYSNYGSIVEISAPGGDTGNLVLSTWNTGTTSPVADAYVYMGGTSMAAPHVSGVASLLYSLNPNLTPAQVLAYLQHSATPFPAGGTCTTANCGSGIVNAGLAVHEVTPTAVELLDFSATGKKSSILLTWETASELNTIGFNLYRAKSRDGNRKLLNSELISTLGSPGGLTGAVYTYKDRTAKPGVVYYYWLEEVDVYGGTEQFGPEKAKR